ncbi:hypothetical protein F441_06442 [Phytophthora nicotianae CJ01A1]|uniref:HAT C-terminal dimerisation domain-containing protein n=2 Tax=Phytophthora nicotianae TaxID=4792 RepID=W2JC68_PHYNI|nr:hypothetical protein L915_06319 [Phytophthora nicotianae]ETL43163.1 hypothetical protein L916_06256 [Phytophthora nicotianae]ETP19632.1 hypothetical protein F441_06442 [Phytophthora nicotianae CJ01A1]
MIQRYFRLREFLPADDDELADYLPSRATPRKLDELLASLCDVESVSKRLQADGLTMLDACDLCDGLVEIQPSFSKYLAANADIVHSVIFEQAACKVLAGRAVSLTDEETDILEPFKRCTVSNTEVQATRKEGFADRILKRRKVSAEPASYALLGAIPPTSNIVERLFSVARSVLRHERHRLSPMMLEMILFLKANGSYWNVATVDQCCN